MKRIAILMTAVLLAGCSAQAGQDNGPILPQAELIGTAGHSRIYRFHDLEQGNTCYVAERSDGSSLDCVPIHAWEN